MELIRISPHKLKIMLTPTDMCHFELRDEDFREGEVHSGPALRHLLEEVKRQVGFAAEDNHFSLRYFPSRRGGCEMFLTHLPPKNALSQDPPATLPVRVGEDNTCRFSGDYAWRMDDLHALLLVCRRLCGISYITESTACKDEKGMYYLLLSVLSPSPFSLPAELQFLSEYGQVENPSMIRLYIKEHGSILCPGNAVEVLGVLG